MNLRWIATLILTPVALFTFLALRPATVMESEKFEAHEFALFRSRYETLRSENASARVSHLHRLADTVASTRLTSGMSEALGEFCETVANAVEEAPEVRAEAQATLTALRSSIAARRDNTAGRRPASVSLDTTAKR